jgi:hypothetical protein
VKLDGEIASHLAPVGHAHLHKLFLLLLLLGLWRSLLGLRDFNLEELKRLATRWHGHLKRAALVLHTEFAANSAALGHANL